MIPGKTRVSCLTTHHLCKISPSSVWTGARSGQIGSHSSPICTTVRVAAVAGGAIVAGVAAAGVVVA